MKPNLVHTIAAIIYAVYGIPGIIVPDVELNIYGLTLPDGGFLPARFAATGLIGLAIIAWMARDDADSAAGRGIMLGLLVFNAISTILFLLATLQGVFSAVGWTAVVVFLLLAAGYAYLYFVRARPVTSMG